MKTVLWIIFVLVFAAVCFIRIRAYRRGRFCSCGCSGCSGCCGKTSGNEKRGS